MTVYDIENYGPCTCPDGTTYYVNNSSARIDECRIDGGDSSAGGYGHCMGGDGIWTDISACVTHVDGVLLTLSRFVECAGSRPIERKSVTCGSDSWGWYVRFKGKNSFSYSGEDSLKAVVEISGTKMMGMKFEVHVPIRCLGMTLAEISLNSED